MKNKKSFGILLSFVLVLAGFIFGSCEIGLGAAVDTEAPAIGITAPEVDAVIRDKFAIRGTWSDDGDIDSLTAKLKRTDGNGEPIIYNGVADVNTGKWQIIVDPEEQNILDGSYEVTVSIRDKGEHVTTQSRTFKIDNTPPLIVLQRPSSKADATSVDTYGQSFTLTGQAADDNNIEHIYVNIYRDSACTDFVTTVDLKNVPPTIEQDVAKFELGVNNDYAAIYGYLDKGHGTVGSYCTINAYDGAQRYPIEGEQTDEDKLGNTTNVYYLYNDIAAAILSETKITEVYHMLDGTSLLKDASRTAAVDNIKTILNANAVTIGSFSLNPDNNPIFTVSGQSPLACNGNDFTADQSHYISNGLTVVVEVSPGLDAIPLDAESLKVYFQECDLNGEPLPNTEKIYYDGNSTLSGSSYKFETLISTTAGLRVGGNYIIDVEGVDQKGNAVRPKSSKYGFHLASNASAPILTVTSPSENLIYKKKGDAQEFAGTISVEEGKPTLTINIGNDNYYTHQVTDADLISSENGKLYGFSFTVPAGGDHGFNQTTSSQYGFTIKASSEGLSSAENRTIIYDVDAPVITIQQITPTAYKYLDEAGTRETDTNGNPVKYLNGLINVKLTISDAKSGVDITTQKPKYEFFLGNSTVPQTLPTYTLDPYGQEINNIDTTAWLNQNGTPYTGPVTFKVTAYDIAGNEKVETIEYQVDQDTDKPVLLPYDASSTTWTMATAGNEPHGINEVTTEGGVQVKNNKNIFINGSQLNLKLIDDDGIKNLKYYYGKLTVDTANNFAFTPITDFGPSKGEFTDNAHSTETTYPCNLPSESGYYQFKVVVTDVNNKSTTVGPFVIKTTPAGADVTIINNNKFIKKDSGDSFTNTIKVENSDQAPFKVYRKLKTAESWGDSIHTIGINDNNTCDDVVQINSTATYQYKVVDDNDHESNVAEIVLTVDGGNPEITCTSGTPNKEKIKLSSFTFKGTAEDKATSGTTDTPSGIDKIYLTVANGNDSTATGYKYRKVLVTGTSDWYYELTFNDQKTATQETGASGDTWNDVFQNEGKKYVTITAIDKVSNESTNYINQSFDYDTNKPTSTFSSSGLYDENGSTITTITEGTTYYAKEVASGNAFTISGSITEVYYKTEKVKLYQKKVGATETPETLTFSGTDNKNWSYGFNSTATNGSDDGTYNYRFTIEDDLGNTNEYSFTVIYDTLPPAIGITQPAENGFSETTPINASGSISDSGIGIKTLEYSLEDGADGTWQDYTIDRNAMSWNTTLEPQNQGEIKIKLRATDYLGHSYITNTRRFSYDKDNPELTFDTISKYHNTGNIELTGKVWDTNKIDRIQIVDELNTIQTTYVETTSTSTDTSVKKEIVVTGNKAEAKSLATALPWTLTLPTTGTGALENGSHTFTVTAIDDVGHSSSRIQRDIIVDTVAPTITLDALPTNNDTKTSNFTFQGTANDGTSGIDTIFLTIANRANPSATGYKYRRVKVTGKEDWYYKVTYSDNTEADGTISFGNKWNEVFADQGVKYVSIEIKDKAGNTNTTYSLAGVDSTSQTFTYDKEDPSLTVNSSSVRNFIPTAGYDITGTAYDTYYFAGLTITEYKLNTSNVYEKTSGTNPKPITFTTGNNWSAHVPLGTVTDGTYKYVIEAKDSVGNTVSWSKDGIKVDTTAPVVTVVNPSLYSANNTITFKGFIREENKDTCTATLQKRNGTEWENVPNNEYELNVDSSITDPTQTNWSQKIYDLENAEYRLYVKAVDQARNEGVAFTTGVTVDTTFPTSTIFGTNLVKDNGVALSATENINTQGETIYYAKEVASGAAYTISGTVTEEHFDSSKITLKVKKDDGAVVTKDLTWAGKTWSYNFSSSATDGSDDGAYKYTLSVTDLANNRTEYTINVTYDTQKPTLVINEPVQNGFSGSTPIAANGSIKDSGIGLKEFKWTTDDGATWTDWTDTSNGTIDRRASSWQMNFEPTAQGEIKLKMKAVDYLGHEFETPERRFSYDYENPVATGSSNAVNGYIKSGNLVLTGKAWDSNKFDSISILDETNSGQITYTEESTPAISITGTKASATTEGTAVDWTLTLPTSGTIENGSHKFTITAKDDAGRTASPASIIIIVDTVAPKITLEALPSRTDTQAPSFTFRGTGSDVTSGVEKVELTIANGTNPSATGYKYRTVKATGKENWYYSVVFEDETPAANETGASGNTWKEVFADEGVKKVTLKVYDKAGLSEDKFTLGEETTEVTEKTFTFDKANPVITLNQGTVLEYMPNGGFDITGTVSDSYKLAGTTEGTNCVTVEEYYKATAADSWPTEAQQTQTFSATGVDNHSGAISIHVPLNNGATEDGRYKYKITVKDSMDNKGTYSTSDQGIIVDKTAPTVTITTPSSNTSHKEQNAIHEQSFKFIGGFTELNEISGIYYKIIKSGTAVPDAPASNVILDATWEEAGFTKVTAGSSTWNSFQSFTTGNTGDYCEGENYKICVYGVDKATNVSTVTTCTFDVDMSAPEIKTQVKENGGSYTDLTVDSTQTKTKTYEFRYYAKDTYGINGSETVVVKKDGDALGTTTSTAVPYYAIGTADDDGYKVITITVPAGVKQDGLYEYTISATDKVGKHTEVNRSIRLDRFGPTIAVQSPDLEAYQANESVTVSGSSDDDSGTLAVYYAYDVSSAPSMPVKGTAAKTAANWSGWTAATGTTSWNFTVTGVEAQNKNLYIVAVDKNGLYENPISKVVRVDKSDPKSAFTKPNAYVSGGNLVLTGTVWDENGIKEVKVSYGTSASGSYGNSELPKINTTGTTYTSQTETSAVNKLASAKSESLKATWKSEIALADEKYNVKVEIKDDAGKVKTETFEVTMDNTAPEVLSPVMDWGSSTVTPHNISTATLSFTVTEANVKSVSYYIDNKSSAITQNTVPSNKWSSISSNTNAYSTNLTFGDGDGNIYIKVEDMAGNVAYGTAQTYDVDTAKPDVCTILEVNGSTETSTIMVNGRSDVPFIVKATDFNARYVNYVQKGADPAQIASVSLISVGSYTVPAGSPITGTKTNATTGEWTITIPTTAFTSLTSGAKPVSVKVTDKAGNSQNFTNLFTLTVDKTAPTVGIATPKDAGDATGTQVNGIIKLEGTAKDTGGSELKSIDICYYVNSTDGWQWHSRVTGDLSNWTSADIDTKALKDTTKPNGKVEDGTDVTFIAIVTDTSDNKNTDVNGVDKTEEVTENNSVVGLKPNATVLPSSISSAIVLNVNQDTDRPTVKFTNLNEENGSYVLKYGTNSILEGTISDDDSTESAVVATFIVSNEEITNTTGWTITPNTTGDTITSTKANCGITVFNKKTGSYTFTPAVTTDGSKTVYFYLVDNGGKIYYTGNTATLNKPYQQYKTDAKADNSAAITYLSDSTAPTIHKVYAHAYKGNVKEDEDIALGTSCIVGGTERNGIDLVVEATDANAITKIVVELDDGTESEKKTYTYTGINITSYIEAGVTYYKAEMPKKVLSTEFPAITSTSERDYVDVTVTVYDGVGLYSNQSSLFVIDLKGPTFNISQPAENSVLYGVNENLVTGTPSATDVSKFYYYVTKAADTEIDDDDWIEIGGESKISKTLVFDGDSVGTHETNVGWHCKTLREWIKTAYNVTEEVLTADDTNKDLYVRFKLVDNCGNIGYSSRKFVIIPNGDMPTLQVTYPLADAKLGGTIRCTGTTEIYTDEISGVYAQIDVSGAMTQNWESTLSAKTDKYTVVDTGVSSGIYTRGIKVSGSPYSWNFSINGSSEFNDVENGKVAIRFFAVSTQNHKVSPVGANQTRIITIDADAPIFNAMRLVQFAADGTITASKAYEEDMWITGQWYIYGDITDDNGVKSITYEDTSEHSLVVPETNNDKSGDVTTTSPYREYVIKGNTNHATTGTTDKAYDYTLKIPIGSSDPNVFGTIRYTVKAIDATDENNSSQKIFIVNYDNKAPEFKATVSAAANAAELATTGIEIKQSNAGYSFNGQFNEEGNAAGNQSGFGRILMYFTRTIGTTTNIIDVSTTKVKTTNNDNKNNYLALTGLSSGTDGYWKSATANISAENTLAVTGLPTFARKGGVVKIDNVLYRITSISGTTVEVDGVLTNAQNKPVYFTPALVIDNLSTESVKDGVTYTGIYSTADDSTSLTNGDGDWLIEGVTKSGASYPWTAMINSTNILDGPITVHFVAYDAAGNMVTKSYSGNVANNAPRLAGVTIWTDYNGDGTGWRPEHTGYKDETKSSYASRVRPEIALVTGQPKERVDRSNAVTNSLEVYGGSSDAQTSYMKITDQVKFIPELVGGNGALYYSFDITGNTGASGIAAADKQGALKNDSGTAVSGTADGDDATIASTLTLQDDDSISYIAGHTDGVITFPVDKVISKLVNTTNTASPTWFNVKIWDSTEGGTPYATTNGTLNCEMKVALDIKYTDDTAPLTYIDDLYWKGASDNSVYKDVNNNLYGHVELKSDYANKVASPTTAANYSELVANYGNNDDKVSGKVVFRGTAYDNKRLGSLTWSFDKTTTDATSLLTGATINYTTGWSSEGDLSDSKPYKFTATDVYCNSDGHKVSWELVVDTSYISGVVAKDACVVVTATDKWTTPNSNSKTTAQYIAEDATDATRSRPLYQVDVVPYITNVETRLSKKDLANTSVYSRTAKGHYAIASNEGAIKLSGYNLAAKSADVTVTSTTIGNTKAYAYTVSGTITSINNMNDNDAKGSYNPASGISEENRVKNMYNRQPNTTTNLKLTDDVYFDVWDLNQTSAASNGALKDPAMHINPSTNQIGFGFVNAVDAVSFPTSEYSYRIMEKNNKDYIGTNFVYDSNGDAHTISIGLDAQQHTSIAGRMNYIYSKWNSTGNTSVRNWNKTNAIALESIGIPRDIYVKGTRNSADLIDIDRFPNPKIAVANHGTTPTVYVMYYDADHDQIRFRQGIIDSGNNSRGNNNFTTFGLLNDSKSEQYRHGDTHNTTIPNSGGTDYDNHGMFEASKEYYAIVTGDYYNQSNYKINNGTAGTLGYSTGNKGSKYYAMDVIAGTAIGSDKVVMIWFDNSTQKLMYAYRTNITETSNMDASSAGVKNGNTTYWSVPKSVFGDTALPLQDCVIKADSKGGIHIAAYDLISADLKYAYMPSYNHLDTSGNTAYTCTVDAYSQCGNCLQIDTVLDSTGNKVIPYISYLSEGMFYLPKVAFIPGGIDPNAPGNAIKDGADKDTKLFTGNWEVSLIPTTSELQKYNVCIGVWRDANGKITKPDAGTDAATDTTDRKRYANGNTNLVLGYSHKLNGIGYMETAMYEGVPEY